MAADDSAPVPPDGSTGPAESYVGRGAERGIAWDSSLGVGGAKTAAEAEGVHGSGGVSGGPPGLPAGGEPRPSISGGSMRGYFRASSHLFGTVFLLLPVGEGKRI